MRIKALIVCTGLLVVAVSCLTYLDRAEAHIRISTDVTWSGEVRDIFVQRCMPCHNPNGAAPDYVDLTFYGTETRPGAWAWYASIQDEVMTGRMPPWNADPRFGRFENSRRLTEYERDLIVAWVEGGRPQGPLRNLPTPEQFLRVDWQFGQPELVVSMPKGHVVPANQQYDHARVRVPVAIEDDTYITGYEFLVEDPRNIARITAFIHDPEGYDPQPIEVEMQVPYDPLAVDQGPAPTRMRPMPRGPHFLGQWVKGDGPVFFPESAGRMLRAGSSIEMAIEYVRPDFAEWSVEIRDNTRLGLFLASLPDEVDLLVETKKMDSKPFAIKAGQKTQLQTEFNFAENVHLIGFAPHLGPVATSFHAILEYPDGLQQILVTVPEYKDEWATTYRFEAPIAAPAGAKLVLTGSFDNTADNLDNPNDPPAQISSGPGYLDERLYAYLDYTLDDHLKIQPVIVPRETPQGGGMLGGFGREVVDPKDEPGRTVRDVTEDVMSSLESSTEPERIRLASNGYHQIQGMMNRPGEFSLYVYDEKLDPIDPRNFSGELVFDGGARPTKLAQANSQDDFLSAWVDPAFPQKFEAKIDLAGTVESVPFRFDRLTPSQQDDTPSVQAAYVNPRHGGWLEALGETGIRVEATLQTPEDLRLYFYDASMTPIDPRSLSGQVAVSAGEGGSAQARADLNHPEPRAEYLGATVPAELPLRVVASLWVGDRSADVSFEFEELTEEPWFDDPAAQAQRLFLGPHGSPEIYQTADGSHFIEAALPRPGELRVYVYDRLKNALDSALFDGQIQIGSESLTLSRFGRKDDYLSAHFAPILPVQAHATVWIAGKKNDLTFSFDDVTVDPALQSSTAVAHMDHTPLHGGQFHMADNMFHHVEGTLPRPGEFRAYFYDDFKRPIDPRNFTGTVNIEHLDEDTGEVTEDTYELSIMQPGDVFLTAILPATLPIQFYALLELGGEPKRFDFAFEELTADTGPPMQMALATGGTPGAPAAHVHYRAPMTIPANVDEILALMATKETDLSQRIASGTLITLYQPALDIKDLVAALAQGDRALDVRRAGKLKLLVGAVNRTVDKIDRAGDTGDGARARSVAQELSGHLNEIRRIFAPGA